MTIKEHAPTQPADQPSYVSSNVRRNILAKLLHDGFVFADGQAMQKDLENNRGLSDWRSFAESWSGLPIDTYMADGGTYRRRRYSVFSTCTASDEFQLQPRRPHFQSRACNTANGGIERWYEPFSDEIIKSASLRTVLKEARSVVEQLSSNRIWHIEAHQFRVEACADPVGEPTPEGVHRDGVDFCSGDDDRQKKRLIWRDNDFSKGRWRCPRTVHSPAAI